MAHFISDFVVLNSECVPVAQVRKKVGWIIIMIFKLMSFRFKVWLVHWLLLLEGLLFVLNFKLKQQTKTIVKRQGPILSERYAIYPNDFSIPTNYSVVILGPNRLLFCSGEH